MPEYRTPRDRRDHYYEDAHPRARQGNYRRSVYKRRRRATPRLLLVLGVLALVVVALVLLLTLNSGSAPQPQASPTPGTVAATDAPAQSISPTMAALTESQAEVSALAAYLGDEDAVLTPLPEEDRVKVSDLSVNEDLPDDWLNILLLGTDERSPSESARTDTMIICSINEESGEVKLTSIMRDVAVVYDDLEEHNGTYRINAANYFGGPEYAMKVVNECFDMNIEHYVTVNFFGFQKVAEALGGIEMDITREEMEQINKNQIQQAKIAYEAGIDESDLPNVLLETYGEDTHLNGRQTLAYARIRKLDSDFTRAERQRKVLGALMEKMKELSGPEIIALGMNMIDHVDTNLDLDSILNVAMNVLGKDASIESFRLPINDSYKQETRNEESMFYDCDWDVNARELYTFIYT